KTLNKVRMNLRLRDVLDDATDAWGVKVEAVEIREVDPVGPVKAAMEEQTAAERQRRAAILRADGDKKSAILVAEGSKRSRILKAEGVRQAKILEAEGSRLAIILEGQGEAQKLRILALGAAPLDSKALTVLSLDTVKSMGNGQATKIVFPFELSRLMEGASEYLGASRKVPDREIAQYTDLENLLGKADDILGPIPKHEELRAELKELEKQVSAETKETEKIAGNKDIRESWRKKEK
ncbi:MAG: SPFH/Band 7/PHB domain protein, partial [Thermoplasmata archaeon]|nr:SPFH/Band 7/PHB domain protein [Thermoplasmata archaeon]